MPETINWFKLVCQKCKKLTVHKVEQDHGNFYCERCGERFGARASTIHRHKAIFMKPEGRVKERTKSKIILVR